MSLACVTFAPRSIAIFVAAPIWPCNPPTMSRRMIYSFRFAVRILGLTCFDDFRHGDAEAVFDEDDFAARDQAVVDVDVDRLADFSVKFDNRAPAELQE